MNAAGSSPRCDEGLFIASQPKQQKANLPPISEENWPSMSYAPASYLVTGCDGATMSAIRKCPQGNSNPCRSLERAVSWSTRRWGHVRRNSAAHTSILPKTGGKVKSPLRFSHKKYMITITARLQSPKSMINGLSLRRISSGLPPSFLKCMRYR